jgi:hypothetical protein
MRSCHYCQIPLIHVREMRDKDGPKIAGIFYRHLLRVEDGRVQQTAEAALALHLTTKELREEGLPFKHWVHLYHIGL